ncbi:MAG: hypothetical protein WC711_04300 [Candidatus Staskawiczbacteria bacterium]|jgi:hypothetical protein
MSDYVQIDSISDWSRVLTPEELFTLANSEPLTYPIDMQKVTSQHILVAVENREGFWNKVLRRKKFTIFINGIKNVEAPITGERTYSWWTKK